jgi:lantibiotic modifying enzyme
MKSWQPLLAEPDADRALGVAESIAHALRDQWERQTLSPEPRNPSLGTGSAGQILFLAYLDQALPVAGWGDLAAEMLGQTIDDLAGMSADTGLYTGFPGAAWVLEHLQGWFLDDEEDPGADIAGVVDKALRIPSHGFDLMQGVAGLGVWAVERSPRPGAQECLRRIVTLLAELAEQRDGTATWRTPAGHVPPDRRAWFPQGFCFTGVAHGAAGVIALLGEAQAVGVPSRPLLEAAVRWLLAQKLPPGERSVFPYESADVLGPDAPASRPTRLAWCHGDLGIAAALLGAARRAGEPVWEGEAVALARGAAARSPEEKSIVDAGLCHGSAGLLHLFNRLYQATGEPGLAEAARFWFERTLELRQPGEGVAGFRAWNADGHGTMGWRADPAFLTGAAGVGLALLAAATPVEPAWDRALLVSIPAKEPGA